MLPDDQSARVRQAVLIAQHEHPVPVDPEPATQQTITELNFVPQKVSPPEDPGNPEALWSGSVPD